MNTILLLNHTVTLTRKYLHSIPFRLLIIILLLFTSGSTFAGDSLSIELSNIRFFESGNDIPARNDRAYSENFLPESRFINIEFNINNLLFNKANKEYQLTFLWKYYNGEEFGRMDAVFNVQSDWQTAYISRGWGFQNKGNWQLGRFTAQVWVDGVLFGEKDFYITPFGTDFISFAEVSKPIKQINSLPGDISCSILHQYKIEPNPFFNYFYDILFSPDGNDLLYGLSHFEYYSGSTGTSTTRDMYLFKNNKQIVPAYYMIRYGMDNNFNKLFYFSLKLTSTNIYDAIGNGYYNGYQIYYGTFALPVSISPDGNKYSYLLNNLPAVKASLSWDAAYEYVMINNNKVQPEALKIAKTVNISKPDPDLMVTRDNSIVYIKNGDNSYNAVYTAKFKLIDNVYYALFNESEMVSRQFDGHISKPYLSADEKNVAYIVEDKKQWFIMLNDKQLTKTYKEIKVSGTVFKGIKDELVFCDNGKNVAYQAKVDGDWYVMKGDEKISDAFEEIESLVASADGSKVCYKAKKDKKWAVYIGRNKVSPDFDIIGDELCFSPDMTKIAYSAADKDNMWVMLNDKQISPKFIKVEKENGLIGKHPLAISTFTFNQAGDKLAYVRVEKYSGEEMYDKMKHSYVMINDIQISPGLINATLFSKKEGELFYAGVDPTDLIMQHVKVGF